MIAIPISLSNIPRSMRPARAVAPSLKSGTKRLRMFAAMTKSCHVSQSIDYADRFEFPLNEKSNGNQTLCPHRMAIQTDSTMHKRNGLVSNRTQTAWRSIHPGGELAGSSCERVRKLSFRQIESRTCLHKTNNATVYGDANCSSVVGFDFRSVGSSSKTKGGGM